MATHPLDPLSADEFRQTAPVLRRDSGPAGGGEDVDGVDDDGDAR